MERMTLKATNRCLLCLLGLMIVSSIIGLEADYGRVTISFRSP